jgi:hypothetical protein
MNTEKLEDIRRDMLVEDKMRTDLDFAMDQLGLDEIVERIEKMSIDLSCLGYEMSFNDVIEYLRGV